MHFLVIEFFRFRGNRVIFEEFVRYFNIWITAVPNYVKLDLNDTIKFSRQTTKFIIDGILKIDNNAKIYVCGDTIQYGANVIDMPTRTNIHVPYWLVLHTDIQLHNNSYPDCKAIARIKSNLDFKQFYNLRHSQIYAILINLINNESTLRSRVALALKEIYNYVINNIPITIPIDIESVRYLSYNDIKYMSLIDGHIIDLRINTRLDPKIIVTKLRHGALDRNLFKLFMQSIQNKPIDFTTRQILENYCIGILIN